MTQPRCSQLQTYTKKNVPVIGEILMVYSYTSTHQRDVISSTSVSNSAYSERVYKTYNIAHEWIISQSAILVEIGKFVSTFPHKIVSNYRYYYGLYVMEMVSLLININNIKYALSNSPCNCL